MPHIINPLGKFCRSRTELVSTQSRLSVTLLGVSVTVCYESGTPDMSSDLNQVTDFAPAEIFTVDDLDTLKVIADPLRLRLRELLYKPKTVKQIASALDLPPTKLYYHVNLLEKHGLIVIVDTRVVSGIIEKHYQASARIVHVSRHLLSPNFDSGEAMTLTLSTFFDSARDDLMRSVQEGNVDVTGDEETPLFHRAALFTDSVYLTDEQAQELYEETRALFQRYSDLSETQRDAVGITPAHHFRTFYALFPASTREEAGDDDEAL